MPVSIHQLEGIAVDDLGKSPHQKVSPRTKVPVGQKPVFISLCCLRCVSGIFFISFPQSLKFGNPSQFKSF
jgi:hypothetical protein